MNRAALVAGAAFLLTGVCFGKMIATHDSATGEEGYGVLSTLLTPFAKCQGKTLEEQYRAGARYFDIRVRRTDRGWVCAHGPWESKRLAEDILGQLSSYGDVMARMWYEGTAPAGFLEQIESWRERFRGIDIVQTGEKKPWRVIKTWKDVKLRMNLRVLGFASWHTLIPIPWMWKKVYYPNPKFNDEEFTFVDWL